MPVKAARLATWTGGILFTPRRRRRDLTPGGNPRFEVFKGHRAQILARNRPPTGIMSLQTVLKRFRCPPVVSQGCHGITCCLFRSAYHRHASLTVPVESQCFGSGGRALRHDTLFHHGAYRTGIGCISDGITMDPTGTDRSAAILLTVGQVRAGRNFAKKPSEGRLETIYPICPSDRRPLFSRLPASSSGTSQPPA